VTQEVGRRVVVSASKVSVPSVRRVLVELPMHSAQVMEGCLWGGPGAEQGVRWRRAILSFWIEKARAIYGESVLENVFTKPVDVWAEKQRSRYGL